MIHTTKASRNGLVAAGVSLAFLATTMISARPSQARTSQDQDAGKATQKVEEKAEVQKQAIVGKVEAKQAVVVEKTEVKAATKVTVKAAVIAGPAKVAFPVAPGAAAAPDALAQQFVQQFIPILRAELRLLTTAAEPAPTLRREIALEGGKALKEAATKMAAAQQGMNLGRGINGIPDPRQLIHEAVEKAAKARLSEDQFKRYAAEQEARLKDQKLAVLQNIITNLDKLMILSKDQRDKLSDSILAQWDDRTYPTIETATIYEGYFPMIPNQVLKPILNDEQMKIWGTANKIQFASVRNYSFFNNQGNGFVDDGGDEDVKAAVVEEAKKK